MWPINLFSKKSKNNVFERLFDHAWYVKKYNLSCDLKGSIDHYRSTGHVLDYSPNPLFDSKFYKQKYLTNNPKNINPLEHYIKEGEFLGCRPNPLFDPIWYKFCNPDLLDKDINLLDHFINYGATEGRMPCADFDTKWYVNNYPEVKNSGTNPLAHFLELGHTGKYDPNPLFDSDFYVRTYIDSGRGNVNPLIHLHEVGKNQGGQPSANINIREYEDQFHIFDGALNSYHFDHSIQLAKHSTTRRAFNRVADVNKHLSSLTPSFKPEIASLVFQIISSTEYKKKFYPQDSVAKIFDYKPYSISKSTYPQNPKVNFFKKIYLIGGSRYLLTEQNFFIHDEVQHFYSNPNAHIKSNFSIKIGNNMLSIDVGLRQSAWIKSGINIMHEYSSNYFHFICETLPRMLLINEANIEPSIPYLIEDNLHKNIYEIFTLVNSNRRPYIKIKPKNLYRCDELYQPSDLCSVIDVYTDHSIKNESTYDLIRINLAIKKCKDIVLAKERIWPSKKRKVYAGRRGGQRGLVNQSKIEVELLKIGFEIVYTDALDLETQIQIFNQCEVIVGPTGAQLTNIVWCKPNTKIFVLASDHPAHQLYMWNMLAKISQSSVKIIQGKRSFNITDIYAVHDDYYIDDEKLFSLIEDLKKL